MSGVLSRLLCNLRGQRGDTSVYFGTVLYIITGY